MAPLFSQCLLLEGEDGKPYGHRRNHCSAPCNDRETTVSSGQFPLLELIEPHPQHACDEFQPGVGTAVAIRSGISGDGLCRMIGQRAIIRD